MPKQTTRNGQRFAPAACIEDLQSLIAAARYEPPRFLLMASEIACSEGLALTRHPEEWAEHLCPVPFSRPGGMLAVRSSRRTKGPRPSINCK